MVERMKEDESKTRMMNRLMFKCRNMELSNIIDMVFCSI